MTGLSRITAAAVLAATALACAAASTPVRQLEWDDLMPKDWNPFAQLEELRQSGRLAGLQDGTAEADRVMQEFISAGRSAPVVPELDGQHVKLPGFVVPLDYQGTEVSEFLLVPYFGACIHVPPPPANQIVYVKSQQPFPIRDMYDPVWVTGTITTQAHWNDVGDAGYTLEAQAIEPYK